MSSTPSNNQKTVTFIQDDVPPLQTGLYTLTATQAVPNQTPGTFTAAGNFIVQGERFTFQAGDIQGVFPPALANGEFDGDLPHVVFDKRTLPWEREFRANDESYDGYSWLAVLLFNDGEVARTPPGGNGNVDDPSLVAMRQATAKELVPSGTPITVIESTTTGTGALPSNILSYGSATLNPNGNVTQNPYCNTVLNPMGYGETPDDPCTVIDIPVALFNKVAPTKADVQYLAHIRETDTTDGIDSDTTSQQVAVVVGNRIPQVNTPSHVFLVSLENMADYLPNDNGTASGSIPAGTVSVRLLTYQYWTFTANNLDQKLEALLENLNTPPHGQAQLTTLQLPITGNAPTPAEVGQALADQAAGQLKTSDATVLVQNALMLGYVPLNHHLRHGGQTVSWYRGPLAPYPVATSITVPISGPDAANNYNPETGLFDISYGAAWQLGQLLALQNTGLANSLYQWRQGIQQQQALSTEQALLKSLLQNTNMFESFLAPRRAALTQSVSVSGLPQDIADWFGGLSTLQGIPFNYLVPFEGMLPQESLRFFYLDYNWIDALIDGALSIGRTTTGEVTGDAELVTTVRRASRSSMRQQRAQVAAAGPGACDDTNPTKQVTGFLMRSQAVRGWPNLRFKGYTDLNGTNEICKLRLSTLAQDVVLCLFDGVVEMLVIEEPPEQLHMGVEAGSGAGTYSTPTLRDASGQEYQSDHKGTPSPCDSTGTKAVACIPLRGDGQTLQIADTATAVQSKLANDFSLTFTHGFTSAEFALEMNKGVVMVEYTQKAVG
jgi:hypothetical protein